MANKPLNILLIEDDQDYAFYIKDILKDGLGSPPPYIEHFSSIEKNLKQINPFDYDLALFDNRLAKRMELNWFVIIDTKIVTSQ